MNQKHIVDSILKSVELYTIGSKFITNSDSGEMKKANIEAVTFFISGLESCKMIEGLGLEFYVEEFTSEICNEIDSFINDFYYHG